MKLFQCSDTVGNVLCIRILIQLLNSKNAVRSLYPRLEQVTVTASSRHWKFRAPGDLGFTENEETAQ